MPLFNHLFLRARTRKKTRFLTLEREIFENIMVSRSIWEVNMGNNFEALLGSIWAQEPMM